MGGQEEEVSLRTGFRVTVRDVDKKTGETSTKDPTSAGRASPRFTVSALGSILQSGAGVRFTTGNGSQQWRM